MSITEKVKNAKESNWLTKDFTKEELAEIKRQVMENPCKTCTLDCDTTCEIYEEWCEYRESEEEE
jgi:hypothetical protein